MRVRFQSEPPWLVSHEKFGRLGFGSRQRPGVESASAHAAAAGISLRRRSVELVDPQTGSRVLGPESPRPRW
jgi:hypothetical protein